MAKVLCLSSQVVWGPVGNTAAVPALQAAGHEVLQIPTILLSHHPGHGKPEARVTDAGLLESLIASVEARGGFADLAAVMTGYFANADQITVAAQMISRLRQGNSNLRVLVDPVLGDHGALYVSEAVAQAISDQLVPLADILIPNAFELSWLTGLAVRDEVTAKQAARQLKCREILVTSVPVGENQIGALLVTTDEATLISHDRKAHVPHGTGDFLAGCYLGHRLDMPPAEAFRHAMVQLHQAITRSAYARVLSVS